MKGRILLAGLTTNLHARLDMDCSRADFLVRYSLISSSKAITLFYTMTNKRQAKQWAVWVFSI